jgi:dihydroxyacetone kinase
VKALEALAAHTPARPGDRTLIDALHPFCYAVADGKTLAEAAIEARKGADATKSMMPKLGRATYVVGEADPDDGGDATDQARRSLPPDPGAWGVAAILEGVVAGLLQTDGKHAESER